MRDCDTAKWDRLENTTIFTTTGILRLFTTTTTTLFFHSSLRIFDDVFYGIQLYSSLLGLLCRMWTNLCQRCRVLWPYSHLLPCAQCRLNLNYKNMDKISTYFAGPTAVRSNHNGGNCAQGTPCLSSAMAGVMQPFFPFLCDMYSPLLFSL